MNPTLSNEVTLKKQSSSGLASLDDEQLERLLSYDGLRNLLEQYETANWGPENEIQYLIELANDDEDKALQLRAIKELRLRRLEAMKNSGLLVTASQSKINPDGSKSVFSATAIAAAMRTNEPQPKKKVEVERVTNAKKKKKKTKSPTVPCKLGKESESGPAGESGGAESGSVGQTDAEPPSSGRGPEESDAKLAVNRDAEGGSQGNGTGDELRGTGGSASTRSRSDRTAKFDRESPRAFPGLSSGG